MSDFFKRIEDEHLIEDWGNVLDWLLDDNRFPKECGWNSGYVGNFTKGIKTLPGITEDNFIYNSREKIDFSKENTNSNLEIRIIIGDKKQEGKNLIRHIRNGIAHGNINYRKKGKDIFVEIFDYKYDKYYNQKYQTAYIFMPITYFHEFYKIYRKIEDGINNNGKE